MWTVTITVEGTDPTVIVTKRLPDLAERVAAIIGEPVTERDMYSISFVNRGGRGSKRITALANKIKTHKEVETEESRAERLALAKEKRALAKAEKPKRVKLPAILERGIKFVRKVKDESSGAPEVSGERVPDRDQQPAGPGEEPQLRADDEAPVPQPAVSEFL